MNSENYEQTVEDIQRSIVEASSKLTKENSQEVRYLDEIIVDPEWERENNLLGNGFLRKGLALLLVGPTGIGKSSFSMQGMIMWALGKPFFGIKPNGQLKILMIQGENDDGDLVEMRDGVFKGINISEDEKSEASRRIQIVTCTTQTGRPFIESVRRWVSEHRPNLLWIDPLFSYLGDSVTEQKVVTKFLREGLSPIIQDFGCGLVLVHHTNKPIHGKEKIEWKAGDFAYLGSGTSELGNWAKAVVGIRSIGSFEIYQVIIGKRWGRTGLVSENTGKPIQNFFIKHGTEGICWQPATEEEAKSVSEVKSRPTPEVILGIVPEQGDISMDEIIFETKRYGVGMNTTRGMVKLLVKEKKLYEWETPRKGTHAAKSYAKHPQQMTINI